MLRTFLNHVAATRGMETWLEQLEEEAQGVLRISRRENLSILAAAMSFYALFAIFPLLLFLFVALTILGGEALALNLLLLLAGVIPEVGSEVIQAVKGFSLGSTGVIGAIIVFWAAMRYFRGLDVAFSKIYGVSERRVLRQLTSALLAMLGLILLMALMMSIGVSLLIFPEVTLFTGSFVLGEILWFVVAVAGFALVFLPLYRILTEPASSVREVLPGTLFAAAGWAVLHTYFGVYVGIAAGTSVGAFGGVVLLILWLYLGNLLILVGAAVNTVVEV